MLLSFYHSRCFIFLVAIWITVIWITVVGLLGLPAIADVPDKSETQTFKSMDQWSCVFAGQQTTFHYYLPETKLRQVAVDWTLLSGSRVIGRGTANPLVETRDDESQISLLVALPELKPGVTMPAILKLSVVLDGKQHTLQHDLHIYSEEPFVEQQEFLKQLRLQLYDPLGSTASILDENRIPYTRLRSLAAIDETTDGLILAGEGISLDKHDLLMSSLYAAASRGVPVLCLASSNGAWPMKLDAGGDLPLPELTLSREDWIRQFDKRFDSDHWQSGRSVSRTLELVAVNDQVEIQLSKRLSGWSWLRLKFPARQTRVPATDMIVCRMELIKSWNETPVPRYLLRHLFEELTPQSVDEKELGNESDEK